MERRLYRGIITPAMVADLGVRADHGVAAGSSTGRQGWPWVKAVVVLALSGIHGYYGRHGPRLRQRPQHAAGRGSSASINELPFVLVIIIVIMVIVKPF